jgi:hypothetical protein
MFMLKSDLDDPYVPFVTSRHSSVPYHEMRHLERRGSRPRRAVGRALVRAGLAVAGLGHHGSR